MSCAGQRVIVLHTLYCFTADCLLSSPTRRALDERLTELKRAGLYNKLSPLVRGQIETSLEVLLQRHITGRERVVQLKAKLDG